ncbi:MAG: DUF1570 domain-containing protein, partial [Phycisphaerales bacterium]
MTTRNTPGLLARLALAGAALLVGCGSGGEGREQPGGEASPTVVRESAPEAAYSTEAWTFEDVPGVLLTSPHYRIYTTTTRTTLRERLPVFMEIALKQYTTALGELPRPRGVMESYVLSSRPQWARMTQRLMGADAEVYLKIQRGGFAAEGKALLYEIGPHDTYAIAAHEGWHQFTQQTFKDPLPVWLEEGVACYMEGFRWDTGSAGRPSFLPWANFERFDELRSAARGGRLMSLQQLVRSSPQQLMGQDPDLALTYYAQLWALVHFLNEWNAGEHREELQRVLTEAATGKISATLAAGHGARAAAAYRARRHAPQLFETYFGLTAEAADADYQAFIKNITRVGAKQQIAA